MIPIIGGSLLGIYEHPVTHSAFELGIRPNANAEDVIMETMMGANPLPAPGMLAIEAMVALIATWFHPKLVDFGAA